MNEWDPISAFTQGDRFRADGLRRNLEAIAARSDDPHVRRLVAEVLAGQKTVRELVRDETFVGELNKGMKQFADSW